MDSTAVKRGSLRPLIDNLLVQSSRDSVLALLRALAEKRRGAHLEDFNHLLSESLVMIGDYLQLVSLLGLS